MRRTGFFFDERCFWHAGGDYAGMLPVGGLVQPLAAGGLPENPETKRRLKNLAGGDRADARAGARRAPIPPAATICCGCTRRPISTRSRRLSDAGGGELGLRAPFGPGGYEIAALSAPGWRRRRWRRCCAATSTMPMPCRARRGTMRSPTSPTGSACWATSPSRSARPRRPGLARRVAVVDWDVHHGNGTEAIFYDDPEVLTISIHQEHNYPLDTGEIDERGDGRGAGGQHQHPAAARRRARDLSRGDGAAGAAGAQRPRARGDRDRLRLRRRRRRPARPHAGPCRHLPRDDPDDARRPPRRSATGGWWRCTRAAIPSAYVPFCGHAVLEELSGSSATAPDPMAETYAIRQPNARMQAVFSALIGEYEAEFFRRRLTRRARATT